MSLDTSAVVVREAVTRLGRSGLEPQELFYEVAARVRRVVPHEASGWMTFDPDTLLPSGTLETSKSPELVRALWRNERLGGDINLGRDLAFAPSPIAVLSELHEAAREESIRVSEILRPAGLSDELRVVLRSGGSTWGMIALYRGHGARPFSTDERAGMLVIAQEVAEGLRRSLARRPEAVPADVVTPGVVTFTADGEIGSATAQARRLVALIPGDAASTLYAVAMDASRNPDGARSRVRLADGHWLLLHGARLHGDGGGGEDHDTAELAVTLLPAPSAEIASLLLRLHGLSAREREVAELLMHGPTTDEIAARLHISPHTLRDHTKAIFAKTGATSRSQLMTLGADPLVPSLR